MTKMKAYADDKLNIATMTIPLLKKNKQKTVENSVGKNPVVHKHFIKC